MPNKKTMHKIILWINEDFNIVHNTFCKTSTQNFPRAIHLLKLFDHITTFGLKFQADQKLTAKSLDGNCATFLQIFMWFPFLKSETRTFWIWLPSSSLEVKFRLKKTAKFGNQYWFPNVKLEVKIDCQGIWQPGCSYQCESSRFHNTLSVITHFQINIKTKLSIKGCKKY